MLDYKKNISQNIYEYYFSEGFKTFIRYKERWINKEEKYFSDDLFDFADSKFKSYRFTIDRLEKDTVYIVRNIIVELFTRNNIEFHQLYNGFDFSVNRNEKQVGVCLTENMEENEILKFMNENSLDYVYIISLKRNTQKNSNRKNILDNKCISMISIEDFFEMFFSMDDYLNFEKEAIKFTENIKNYLGKKTIETLSPIDLASFRNYAKKTLREWPYTNKRYQIINPTYEKLKINAESIQKITNETFEKNIKTYIDEKLYTVMVGTENFAESFITAEWLYQSLKDNTNFDYTVIISGYLKSIEQLLFKIVEINIDNNCKISMKTDKEIWEEVEKNKIPVYKWDKKKKVFKKNNGRFSYPYIDFTTENKNLCNLTNIGTFEYFLRLNKEIFVDSSSAESISNMISCFRAECRNGFFHTHNLHDINIVNKTRENSILLYEVLFGGIKQVVKNKKYFGISEENHFF